MTRSMMSRNFGPSRRRRIFDVPIALPRFDRVKRHVVARRAGTPASSSSASRSRSAAGGGTPAGTPAARSGIPTSDRGCRARSGNWPASSGSRCRSGASIPPAWPTIARRPPGRSRPSFDTSASASDGLCWPSPSMIRMNSPVAARMPLFTAAPLPLLYGWRTTRAPAPAAASAVPSVDPSSTTMISRHGRGGRELGDHGRDGAGFVARGNHDRHGPRIGHQVAPPLSRSRGRRPVPSCRTR